MASTKQRFDWFQSETDVVLTIMKKGVKLEDCQVLHKDRYLTVKNGEDVVFEGELSSDIKSAELTVQCTPVKIEIKLPKFARGERWSSLLAVASNRSEVPASSVSFAKKNWDAIEKQAIKDEDEEELEGDSAVNKMFKKIYDGASDDVKKAMLKSYQESAGTVLSTNWDDVKKNKVEVKPPDCMEYKKYDS